jgi:hypothetical protein
MKPDDEEQAGPLAMAEGPAEVRKANIIRKNGRQELFFAKRRRERTAKTSAKTRSSNLLQETPDLRHGEEWMFCLDDSVRGCDLSLVDISG